MSYDAFCSWTGLKLTTAEGVMLDELPPIQRFLNRVLALPIHMLNALFGVFMEKIETATRRALAAGTLVVGLEILRGDKITASALQELRRCPKTDAVTSLVPLTIENSLSYHGADAILDRHPRLQPMRNAASGSIALISPRPAQVFDGDGG
nr:strawberry notch C-terminal domain-containing protein [Ruegeria sp. ANG-R]